MSRFRNTIFSRPLSLFSPSFIDMLNALYSLLVEVAFLSNADMFLFFLRNPYEVQINIRDFREKCAGLQYKIFKHLNVFQIYK